MKLALKAVAAVVALTAAMAGPALADPYAGPSHTSVTWVACTSTANGGCIHRGHACHKSQWHKSGWTASGRRLVCRGSHAHPHWKRP